MVQNEGMRSAASRIFTVDVEDPWQAYWHKRRRRVAGSRHTEELVLKILELLRRFDTKATFFIVGTLAETNHDIVREISLEGHEIGLHGYHHTRILTEEKEDHLSQLRYGKEILEEISQQEVQGFRAPFFIPKKHDTYLYPILKKCGFVYDSSVLATGQTYNMSTGVKISRFGLLVVPLPTFKILNSYIPICGGGYLRYFPLVWTELAFFLKKTPVVLYTHPYEFSNNPFRKVKKYPLTFIEKVHLMRVGINCGNAHFSKIEKILARQKFNNIGYLIEHSGLPMDNLKVYKSNLPA